MMRVRIHACGSALGFLFLASCSEVLTAPSRVAPTASGDAIITPQTHVLSTPTDAAVQQWAAEVSADCAPNVSAVIMPGNYVLSHAITINNPGHACSPSRQITIAAYTSLADTLYQTYVYPTSLTGHYPTAENVFHVLTPNVTISDNVIGSNGSPGNDTEDFAGAGVRFEGDSGASGAVRNNHIFGMQSSGVDTYNSSNIVIDNNTISCTSLSGVQAGNNMGINVRARGGMVGIVVTNNHVSNCNDEAILTESASGVRVVANTIDCSGYSCGYGIVLQGHIGMLQNCSVSQPTSNSYVGYNTINGYSIRAPILMWGDGPTVSDTLEENNVNGAIGMGIDLAEAVEPSPYGCPTPPNDPSLRRYAFVHNNRVQDAVGYGIYIGGDHAQVFGNYVHHSNNGIVVEQGADYADIESGHYDTNNFGLVVRSRYSTIYGNGMYNNTQWGVCYDTLSTLLWNDYSGNAFGNIAAYTYGSSPC
jgi:hypothetical protein